MSTVATTCMGYETRVARQGTRRNQEVLATPTVEIRNHQIRSEFQKANCNRCDAECARAKGFRKRSGIG